jgi:hypothetical protein
MQLVYTSVSVMWVRDMDRDREKDRGMERDIDRDTARDTGTETISMQTIATTKISQP